MKAEKQLIFVIGVSGCGKTTIGKAIATALDIPFYDADDFHPESNRKKMEAQQPLTDADRYSWLLSIRAFSKAQLKTNGLVFACSALKESYRALLVENITNPCHWIHLAGDYDLILKRMQARQHFMPTALLRSQFETLEPPAYGLEISIEQTVEAIVAQALDYLKKA